MDDELYTLLSSVAETHMIALEGAPKTGIVYRLAVLNGAAYEGCKPLAEVFFYVVLVYMTDYDAETVQAVKAALRENGWIVGNDEQSKDQINGTDYFVYSLQATKWRET